MKRPKISDRDGVDMSPQAIAIRLRDMAELFELGRSLARARYLGTAKERYPDWGDSQVGEERDSQT